MRGYIFTKPESAEAALAAVNQYAGYPKENTDYINSGRAFTTQTYCDIIPHPGGDRWAILQDDVTEAALPGMEAEEMEADWWQQ